MKEQTIEIIKGLVGETELYFDTSLLIKLNPHYWPIQIWAVCVKGNRIALMDGYLIWTELEETDTNYQEVLSTLFQRVSRIEKTFKTAI